MKRRQLKMGQAVKQTVITGALVAAIFVATGCSKKSNVPTGDENIITPIVTIDATPTVSPTPIVVTPAPGVTAIPTEEPTPEPTPTTVPEEAVTDNEADEILGKNVDLKIYQKKVINNDLKIDGKSYICYRMSADGKDIQPDILIEKATGNLYLYDSDGNLTAFTKFPVDKSESITSGDSEITQEDALALLKKLSAKKLGLKKELSKYAIASDSWTTVVKGRNCYGFDVHEGTVDGQLVGKYYVSTSGTDIYRLDDENGEFLKIN